MERNVATLRMMAYNPRLIGLFLMIVMVVGKCGKEWHGI